MKKRLIPFLLVIALLPVLAACGGNYDYTVHISEAKSDIFRAETEEFTVTVSCVSREYPFGLDGIACPKSDIVEISLIPAEKLSDEYTVELDMGTGKIGGEMSYRNAFADYYLSESVDAFPDKTVSVTVSWGEETREITATSVKNENTLSVEDALGCAIEAENERIERMTSGGSFCGEFHVRLLRRDKNYYYVGIIDRDGETLSLLLDSETGEVLARRDTRI